VSPPDRRPLRRLATRTSWRFAARRHHVPVGHADASPDPAATRRGPVPADLAPPLENAVDDLPVIYADDCHLDVPSVTRGVFGDPAGDVTVVLFGDSPAASGSLRSSASRRSAAGVSSP
jgi:hypothetical protein